MKEDAWVRPDDSDADGTTGGGAAVEDEGRPNGEMKVVEDVEVTIDVAECALTVGLWLKGDKLEESNTFAEDLSDESFADDISNADAVEAAPNKGVFEGPCDDGANVALNATCVVIADPNDGAASVIVFNPNMEVVVVVVAGFNPKGFTYPDVKVPDPKDPTPDPDMESLF
jgi:hypothetical protein